MNASTCADKHLREKKGTVFNFKPNPQGYVTKSAEFFAVIPQSEANALRSYIWVDWTIGKEEQLPMLTFRWPSGSYGGAHLQHNSKDGRSFLEVHRLLSAISTDAPAYPKPPSPG